MKKAILSLVITAITAGVVVAFSSCSLFRLRRDLGEIDRLVHIEGEISGEFGGSDVVVGVIRYDRPLPALVNYSVFGRSPAEFEFFVSPGTYQLFAYRDRNGDFVYQDGEPAVRSAVIKGRAGDKIDELLLELPQKVEPELVQTIENLKRSAVRELPAARENLGKVVDLNDESFEKKNAQVGMWEPLRFVKEIPFGLFFLEPYSSKKIPVLFVHGINSTPRCFEELINTLDRARFQPWVAYYPTGLRLDLVARSLDSRLTELRAKHGFSKIYLVAHSMGGLVSRAVVLLDQEKGSRRMIRKFVTLSTPWGGHSGAESGKESPVVMPVWIDMAPSSEFLQQIFTEKLKSKTPYYLLFSFKGGASVFGGNNDGVVSLESELRLEAQNDAELIRGFNADHEGILEDPEALKLVHSILAQR